MGLVEAWGGTWTGWFLAHLIEAPYNIVYALLHPGLWLDWSNTESLARFIYFGASVEMFFVFLFVFLVLTIAGMIRNQFMWGMVRGFEATQNFIGRTVAWAGLIMVIQQVVIVFMQRVFAASQIGLGLGNVFTFDISWWSEELKLYNAMVVALCVSYTFIQKGHVRVDLIYAAIGFRAKRVIDMLGSLFFMIPAATLIWLYGWFFLWRHLVVPNPNASMPYDRIMMQARALRWNVETVGFSPNGFNAYFLFKVLLVLFTALVFLQAITFFYRSYLEWKEGEASEDKYLDRDSLGAGQEAYEGTH